MRREIVRELKGTDLARDIKRSRWPLLKNAENTTARNQLKLSEVEKASKPLFRAYLPKEALRQALSCKQVRRARRELRRWIGWAARSRLEPFKKLSRTIRRHLDGIVAYVELQLTNGLVEGINARSRVSARRAHGHHRAHALMAMVMLCNGGIELDPALP